MGATQKLDAAILDRLPPVDAAGAAKLLEQGLRGQNRVIVVLDDDPTGVQTVHDVSVYTDWSTESIARGFAEEAGMFFILTNSRGFTAERTGAVHEEIGRAIARVSANTGKDYLLVSRGDSTLRGHYPLETQALRQSIEQSSTKRFDGEILFPFFLEGGRYTIDNIHYVKDGQWLVPAGETEFAKDNTFGYKSSDLRQWCAEKNGGAVCPQDVTAISLESLRRLDMERITAQLLAVDNFGKVIVNAACYSDVQVFVAAYLAAVQQGKVFLLRSAAAVPKVLGGVPDQPLLGKKDLVAAGCTTGGIILAGSHVNKTTRQLEALRRCRYPIEFIEFDQHRVLQENGLASEARRVIGLSEQAIAGGRTVAVYTRRERLDFPDGDGEQQLQMSVAISDALTGVIGGLSVRPRFIVAKGGITSSDVGTKALGVKRADVMGQIKPGIPVWRTGAESKFPGMAYVIFPGNVGDDNMLLEIVECLMEPDGT